MEGSKPGNQEYAVAPGATLTVFSGTRSTSISGTTELALANWDGNSLYRLTWTGVGTAPGFRTDRNLSLNGDTLTLTSNTNGTLTMVGPALSFSAMQAGDWLFLPGPSTGDSPTVFATENEGYWLVLTASSTTLQLRRFTGTAYTGASEVVVVSSDSQVVGYTASGVQVGDTIRLSAGFSTGSLKSYEIVSVTPEWVEFYDSSPLPVVETAVPTASGVTIYSEAKKFLYLEYNQECVLQFNGDSGMTNRVAPLVAGSDDDTGIFVRTGPCWSLSVVNTSQETLKLLVGGVE